MEDILEEITRTLWKRESVVWEALWQEKGQDLLTKIEKPEKQPVLLPAVQEQFLKKQKFFFIAECKKASPSKGLIRENYDALALALAYERAGASAISVLTESMYFQGSLQDLATVSRQVSLPVLRKDFMVHPAQFLQAKERGAKLCLLIVRLLSAQRLRTFLKLSAELLLTPLVEVYDENEAASAVEALQETGLEAHAFIGINSRNLRDFKVSLPNLFQVKEYLLRRSHVALIAESGIADGASLVALREEGFSGALVGESLLRSESPGEALQKMLAKLGHAS